MHTLILLLNRHEVTFVLVHQVQVIHHLLLLLRHLFISIAGFALSISDLLMRLVCETKCLPLDIAFGVYDRGNLIVVGVEMVEQIY